MPTPHPQVEVNPAGTFPIAVVTTAETVGATLAGVTVDDPSRPIVFLGYMSMTAGTATTSLTLKLRAGTTTAGTLLFTDAANSNIAAAESGDLFMMAVIYPTTTYTNQSFVLTVTAAGANANGSILTSNLVAVVR